MCYTNIARQYVDALKTILSLATLQKNDFHVTHKKKSLGQKAVQHSGSVLWNSIPSVLKFFVMVAS